ncbi:MAG: gyrase subunit A protein, partial [candidate division Kazan bacterium GW2011_GWA1_44_22]
MAKSEELDNGNNIGKVEIRILEQEMQESYLDYAMSVIISRALPDARDGLKPVHRRVLFAMNETGLRHAAKFRKSAYVVGEVLGKYHPHGDMAVYDTIVRLAQNFSMRYPLVQGQGNFGSVDGDSAAAPRYTEARMSAIAEELLADIDKNTVDFMDNYDGTRKEPKVLPTKVPQLLLNGTMGIAVGMATSIPPHNLGELMEAVALLIDKPEADVEELIQIVPGPDFPTGGIVYNPEEIKEAYVTGKGRVVMRAVAEIEEAKKGYRIVITEIPYQVNKSDLVSRIAELVKTKKIVGISDLRDESDKDGMRIVVELKPDSYPKKVLNQLYKLTAMQSTFHINLLALVDNGLQPEVLNLKKSLELFITHRQEVVTRRTQFELNKTEDRAHILEGLKIALDNLDAVISTIRKSDTKEIAHVNLVKQFK